MRPPIPDINNEAAMLERGRRSALMSARNDACNDLRDISSHAQGCDVGDLAQFSDQLAIIAERLKVLSAMWNAL